MRLSGLSITLSETINIGNYESVKPEITVSAELEPEDDLDLSHAQLLSHAKRLYAEQALEQLRAVYRRRRGDDIKKVEFQNLCDPVIAQFKEQLSTDE